MRNRNFKTVKEVLLFMIDQEQLSFDLYHELAKKSVMVTTKLVLEQLANDELRHKVLLTNMLEDEELGSTLVKDGDYLPLIELITVEDSGNVKKKIFQEAINSEIEAYNTYASLMEKASDPKIKALLLTIAKEELTHRKALDVELENLVVE